MRHRRKLRVTRKPFLPEMTDEEKEADRERRANRPPREDGDRGGRRNDRGRGRRYPGPAEALPSASMHTARPLWLRSGRARLVMTDSL